MAQRITDTLVKNLVSPETGNQITYDTEIKGFGIRMTAGGAKAFILNYRFGRQDRRRTIGTYGDWSVAAAREEAKRLKREISQGRDPMAERHEVRTAPTVKQLADRYIKGHLTRKSERSQHDDAAMIEAYILPRIGQMTVKSVVLEDIDALHQAITKRSKRNKRGAPIRANRVLAVLSKMFAQAMKWGWRADNPCKGVERNHEIKRKVYLSQEEIAKVSDALLAYPNQIAANALRFLMFTGARSGEVMTATWGEFDLEKGVWTKPSAHTKQKEEHTVPLSAPALEVLARMKAEAPKGATYVFPGRGPSKPIAQLRSCWVSVSKKAGLNGVRPHDLRHTYASILASAGVSLPLIGGLLGHTQPQTTARYAHLYDAPLREATERVGAFIESAGKESAEVIDLSEKRKA